MSLDEVPVVIHTDGACVPNPGPGDWGAVLRHGGHLLELCGGDPTSTTNNRMELTAPTRALEALTRSCVVDLWTDSTYVRSGITSSRWQRRPRAGTHPHHGATTVPNRPSAARLSP